jgi:hypothetical protein
MDEVDAIARRIGIDPRQLHDQIIAADGACHGHACGPCGKA